MSDIADRPMQRRWVGALLALVSVVLLAVVASAAILPRVDNPHGKFKENCELCHSSKAWKEVKVSPKFNHAKYGFPLTGAHATTNCLGCHTSLDFAQSKTQCASCHTDPHRGEMGSDCARCHGSRSFLDRGPMVRAHQSTRFPLTGGHAALDCETCHKPAAQGQMQFVNTKLECYSCHKDQYTTAPGHVSGGFSTQCQTCHTPVKWSKVGGFDHTGAGFPLTGGHAMNARKCDDCHHGAYTHTSADCYSCHATSSPGYSTANPPHTPTAFPTNTAGCIGCHVQANATHVSWSGANSFDHAAAGFPLNGSHSLNVRQCNDCHAVSGYNTGATSKACETCHTASTPGYNNPGAGAPAHNTTYFPYSQCTTCHQAAASGLTSWAGGTYTHQTMQMTNAHANRACEDCHKGNYTTVAFNCYSCHQPAYAAATSPKHTPANFPIDNAGCLNCHNTTLFKPSTWPANHSTTAFGPYWAGKHSAAACTDCHNASTWNVLATGGNCYGCHLNSTPGYANPGAGAPAHNATYFPAAQCATCHASAATTFNSWAGGTYTHSQMQLTNAHANRACDDCHKGNYSTVAFNCYSCHQPAYAAVPVVKHTPANFPTTNTACQTCHNTTVFSPSTWPANHSTTAFAASYTGAHPSLACTDCHNAATWNVQGTGNNCYGCHSADYAGTTNPKHDTANFPPAGCMCHNTTNWTSATVHDHAAAGFSMLGQHSLSVRLCGDCHTASGFGAGATSKECYSCHANSTPGGLGYSTATPPHNPTSFPTATAQCTGCHTAAATSFTTWAGGTYTHQTMQLTNAHANRACEDCHKGNYTTVAFNCYSCHQPAYASVAVVKHTPANFPIDNASCQNCHNTTLFKPATWPANHSTTAFAAQYTGAHLALACTDCHNATTFNVQGTGANCYGCHAADYAGTTNPKHDTVNYPVAGCICHTTMAWSPATGHDHTAAGFPLIGLHSLTSRQCSDCHTVSGYGVGATSKDCYTCHAATYAGAAPPHNPANFPTATANCTSCHATAASALTSWSGGTYTHATMQLTNAHANRACEDCHKGNYSTVAFNCYSCHQAAYAAVAVVKHTPANFPTDNASCQNCHNTTLFKPATWPANHSTTAFAAQYTGAHLALACTDCHNASTWNVQGTGANCYGCHAADYAGTTNPKHDTVNYPVAGCICHSTTAWSPATGHDHTAAGFPLTGDHSLTVRQCADCHAASGYGAGATSKECYSCHVNQYNTTVVKHSSPNFPTTTAQCITCHAAANTNHVTWMGGVFTAHATVTTNFALTGNHAGYLCSDCHTSAGTDLKQYTCSVSCHSGDSRFNQHENKSCAGTTFNAAKAVATIKACYSCHPRGTSSSPCG